MWLISGLYTYLRLMQTGCHHYTADLDIIHDANKVGWLSGLRVEQFYLKCLAFKFARYDRGIENIEWDEGTRATFDHDQFVGAGLWFLVRDFHHLNYPCIMAAIYFPPSIGVSHASQLEDYLKCTMVNELPACLPDPLIIVDEIIYFTSKSTVFSATCQDKEKTKLAIKFSPVDNLLTEAFVYHHLEDLQGKCIPKLYGMFFGKTIQGVEKACIITHYVGERLNTFLYKLPRQDRFVLRSFHTALAANLATTRRADILSHLSTIHAHGYSLPDLAERNILKATNGSYWLIDFENAVIDKKCSRALDFHLITILKNICAGLLDVQQATCCSGTLV